MWHFDSLTGIASHAANGVRFTVDRRRLEGGQLGLTLLSGRTAHWTPADWADHRAQISEAVAAEEVREAMKTLVQEYYANDYGQVVRILKARTGRHSISVRALQTWLADSSRPSSRRCPPWALAALKADFAEQPANAPIAQQRMDVFAVTERDSVRQAEDRKAAEDRIRAKWHGPMAALPDTAADMEIRQTRWSRRLDDRATNLETAILAAPDFDALKRALIDGLRALAHRDAEIDASRSLPGPGPEPEPA